MDDEYWSLLVDGYIREQNEKYNLIIPDVINEVIFLFYEQNERYFAKYNPEKFRLENDNKTIIPIGDVSDKLSDYIIFPSPNGFSKGIHRWAVKFVSGTTSTRSIGITTEMDDTMILQQVEDRNSFGVSRWTGEFKWRQNETIEVILDLENLVVSCYRIQKDWYSEEETTSKEKEDKLEPNKTYYFAMCIDSDKRCCIFESVTPKESIRK